MRGLADMLENAGKNPTDSVIRERALVLLADMPDDAQKVEFAVNLARALVEREPREAMRIAYMVYQFDPRVAGSYVQRSSVTSPVAGSLTTLSHLRKKA